MVLRCNCRTHSSAAAVAAAIATAITGSGREELEEGEIVVHLLRRSAVSMLLQLREQLQRMFNMKFQRMKESMIFHSESAGRMKDRFHSTSVTCAFISSSSI